MKAKKQGASKTSRRQMGKIKLINPPSFQVFDFMKSCALKVITKKKNY